MEDEKEAAAVVDFVRKEVGDWDDEVKLRARFKALSGQRSDWEPLYLSWRDLILKVARHLNIFFISPSRVTGLWFRGPGGITPLCLPGILVEMQRAGDLSVLPTSHSPVNNSFRLSQLFRKALDLLTYTSDDDGLAGEYYVVVPLLQERALQVLDVLSESHWTSSCVVTMKTFEAICRGSKEAVAILNHLSASGKATRLIMDRANDSIEGVKVCLAPGAVSIDSSMDYSVLHLTWTAEKLEQQLDLIDQRFQKTRNSAIASLKSGNKKVALKFAKEMKVISLSTERCTALLERVEKVLNVIVDADSSKKISEAIKSGSHAIRENMISVEEVEQCLHEVDVNIDSLKQIDDALESTPVYVEIDDEDIEDEFDKLQLEIKSVMDQVSGKSEVDSETSDALSKALSNLNLKGDAGINSVAGSIVKPVGDKRRSEEGILEAA